MPAGQRAVHHDRIAGLEAGDALADRRDLAGCLDADDLRHLALGEGHAAEAPEIEMVERDDLGRNLHLARGGRRRGRDIGQFELAVSEELERANGRGHAGSRPITSETFCPPKPNELEMACRTLASRASFGTTSIGMAGSGT